jgi:hypothetical protein
MRIGARGVPQNCAGFAAPHHNDPPKHDPDKLAKSPPGGLFRKRNRAETA